MSKNSILYDNIMCRACLRSEDGMKQIGPVEMLIVKQLSLQEYFSLNSPLCLYCWSLIIKFRKFQDQCKRLKAFFDGIYNEDLINQLRQSIKINKLSINNDIIKHSYNDINDKKLSNEKEDVLSNFNEEVNYNDYDSNQCDDDFLINDNDVKYNDISVSMLDDNESKQENNSETETNKNRNLESNNEMINKDIFTKRMVKETDQYKVVKLTKEQVREELKDRLNSDKYLQSRFKCDLCARGFNFEDVLENHKEKHVQKPGYLKCDICHQYCPGVVSMRGHIKSHTTRYKCKMCDVIHVSRQQLLEHFSIVHCPESTRYNCSQCDFNTVKRTLMQRHVKSHNPVENHTCHCGVTCKTIEALRVHKLRHDVTKKFSCPHCERKFPYPTLLKSHIERAHINKDLYCVECDKYFLSNESLKSHFKRAKKHVDPSIIMCRLCNHQSKSQSEHEVHKKTKHMNVVLSCTQCTKVYSSKEGYRSHVRNVHGVKKDGREKCDLCERTFTKRSSLIRHKRVHTGERPFGCDFCSSMFAQSSTRDTHVALVHKKGGRKKISSKEC